MWQCCLTMDKIKAIYIYQDNINSIDHWFLIKNMQKITVAAEVVPQ